MNTPVTLQQEISIRRATHDGYIWIPAKVARVAQFTFMVTLPSYGEKKYYLCEEGLTWRREG